MRTLELRAAWSWGLVLWMLLAPLVCSAFEINDVVHANPAKAGLPGYQDLALKGVSALQSNQGDSARILFLQSYQEGMSKDSLYYFLSESALAKLAYDTALAFNLSIRTPRTEPFRQAVLIQRHRLYKQAGLAKDAESLSDSLRNKPYQAKERLKELYWRLGSGYFREGNYPTRLYPYGLDLGDLTFDGWQFRNQVELLWPLGRPGNSTWKLGVTGQAIKSYAKDSLDYRAGLLLRTYAPASEKLSFSLSGSLGKVTGTGLVSAYKLESAYLSFSATDLTMITGGYESEWNESWRMRFDGCWFSFYHDRSMGTGTGFNFSFTSSALRTHPISENRSLKVIYVDDVQRSNPTHFQNGSFQDSLAASGISTFLKYTSAAGQFESVTRSPQGMVIMIPALAYSFRLPWKFSGEVGGNYALTYYPDAYQWRYAPLPEHFQETSAGDFLGLALNREDGKMYSALMLRKNGGFQEFYGPSAMQENTRYRLDQQLGAGLSLRHSFPRWGTVALDAMYNRNWSNLAGMAPISIPRWEAGSGLKWSRSWEWQ